VRERCELVRHNGQYTRLTVMPIRMTVKVANRHWDRSGELYWLSVLVSEQVDTDIALRGCWDVENQRISMYTGKKVLYGTYQFA